MSPMLPSASSTRSIRFWRRLCQSGAALAFIVIPLLNTHEVTLLTGNFLAFNFAGLPLSDPLAALQAGAGAFAVTPSMAIGMGFALALACLMGTVFCSWICPFGFLSELAHPRNAPGRDTARAPQATARTFAGKALLVCLGLLAVMFFVPIPFLNQLSLPGW